ncbi:hypothetical protein GGX14DRAFT_652248 [Mycena pura]|uniref:Uncharacterized protein n=1 Tax=Mycena pura TaxID=153505 RepID=A0AAD6YD45_9AGAR|nr:hypothetical protein GGX14DRAFT_652248 [Mycena pura]
MAAGSGCGAGGGRATVTVTGQAAGSRQRQILAFSPLPPASTPTRYKIFKSAIPTDTTGQSLFTRHHTTLVYRDGSAEEYKVRYLGSAEMWIVRIILARCVSFAETGDIYAVLASATESVSKPKTLPVRERACRGPAWTSSSLYVGIARTGGGLRCARFDPSERLPGTEGEEGCGVFMGASGWPGAMRGCLGLRRYCTASSARSVAFQTKFNGLYGRPQDPHIYKKCCRSVNAIGVREAGGGGSARRQNLIQHAEQDDADLRLRRRWGMARIAVEHSIGTQTEAQKHQDGTRRRPRNKEANIFPQKEEL